ncbi:hypothetical protein [Gloeocapsopsis sp. IPPAS B-1203]|nr:hypothetical protein [Gloeocapsopsis sp. IPPAS B-1203]
MYQQPAQQMVLGHLCDSTNDVEKIDQAWFKSMVLQVTLWSYPYVKKSDF